MKTCPNCNNFYTSVCLRCGYNPETKEFKFSRSELGLPERKEQPTKPVNIDELHYIILVQVDESEEMYAGPVDEEDGVYLKQCLKSLKPLSEEEYVQGPAAILSTLARFSYVLLDEQIIWCIEWEPGFIVIAFSPDGSMAWNGFTKLELDEDEDDPQYNLIFDAWDAQFDESDREWFFKADPETIQKFSNAINPTAKLHEKLQTISQEENWFENAKSNIRNWLK